MDKRVDLAVAVGFFAFGVWLLVESFRIPQGSVPDSIGSGGVARVLAAGILVLAGLLIVRRVASWRRTVGNAVPPDGSVDDPGHPSSTRRGALMFALLVAYALGVRYVGYPIVTPVFAVLALVLMQVRSVLKLVAIPLTYTVATYTLFVGVFGVLLPLGVLSTWDYYLWFHF
jgi:hypothetical protein